MEDRFGVGFRLSQSVRRHPVATAAGLVTAVLVFVYASPLVSPELRETLASHYADLPLRVLVIVALATGLSRLPTPSERRFWTLILTAYASWFVTDLSFHQYDTFLWGLFEDSSFLLFYPLLAIALEQRPGRFSLGAEVGSQRWACSLVGVLTVLWVFAYFIGTSAFAERALYMSATPSFGFFFSADILIAAIAIREAFGSNGRWRALYSLLALAMVGWAVGDLLDTLVRAGRLDIPFGGWTDFFWFAPHLIMIAACDYRNSSATSGPRQLPDDDGGSLAPSMFSYLAYVPVLHLAVSLSGWSPGLGKAREATLVAGLIGLLSVALYFQARHRHQRDRFDGLRVLVLNEEVQRNQKMEALGRLAGGIAHDFNNLLLLVQGNVDLIQEDLRSTPEGEVFLKEMHSVVDHGSALTRQLLTFGSRDVAQKGRIAPNDVVAEVESLLRRTLGDHIELRVEKDEELWDVEVHAGMISQILINLSLNARHAMPDGGRLTIRTSNVMLGGRPGGGAGALPFVQIEVEDTGRGMDEETRERIFEPFFTTRGEAGGTGLGLSVVYGIVKQHGGHVSCESHENRGTRFQIHLPRAGEVSAAERVAPESLPSGKGGRETVLLAEDEPSIRSLTSRFLQSVGYDVIEAQDGVAALELFDLHKETIDLLVTDVQMPKMGGFEVAKHLLARRPDLRVLYVSGYAEDLPQAGPEDLHRQFLQKPFRMAELAARLRQMLDSSPRATPA